MSLGAVVASAAVADDEAEGSVAGAFASLGAASCLSVDLESAALVVFAGALALVVLGGGASFCALGTALGDGASVAGGFAAVCAKAIEEVASNRGPAARSATTEAFGMANDPALSDPTRAARAVSHAGPISVKGAAAGPGTVIDDSAPIGCHHVGSQCGCFPF